MRGLQAAPHQELIKGPAGECEEPAGPIPKPDMEKLGDMTRMTVQYLNGNERQRMEAVA